LKSVNKFFILFFIITIISGFNGCSSSSDSSLDKESDLYKGSFIDSPVKGIEYKTQTQTGITDSQGIFYYFQGETISFYAGDIKLGETTAKSVISPVDLVKDAVDETHPHVINIARLMQSLDYDSNPENGIDIKSQINNMARWYLISFEQSIEDFENDAEVIAFFDELNANNYFPDKDRWLCSAQDASDHLGKNIENTDSSDDDDGSGGDGGDSGGDSGGGSG